MSLYPSRPLPRIPAPRREYVAPSWRLTVALTVVAVGLICGAYFKLLWGAL